MLIVDCLSKLNEPCEYFNMLFGIILVHNSQTPGGGVNIMYKIE